MTAQRAWTVGALRAAITGLPDDTLLIVNAPDFTDPDFVTEQVITSAGFGTVDWGDGYGPEQSKVFGLECEIPDGPIELRAGRARALTTDEPLTRHMPRSPRREPSPRPELELEAEP